MWEAIAANIANQIPWWVYLAVGLAAVGSALWFASPIVLPIWRMIPLPARVAFAGIGAAFLAWIAGRNKGARDARTLQRENDARAIKNHDEVQKEVRNLSPAERDRRLNEWMRD